LFRSSKTMELKASPLGSTPTCFTDLSVEP
jgi:hypothetical protein